MSYMGFCASSGADYMNHLIADRVVAPPDLRFVPVVNFCFGFGFLNSLELLCWTKQFFFKQCTVQRAFGTPPTQLLRHRSPPAASLGGHPRSFCVS